MQCSTSMIVNVLDGETEIELNSNEIEKLPEPQQWMDRISRMDKSSKVPKTDLEEMIKLAKSSHGFIKIAQETDEDTAKAQETVNKVYS